MTTVTAKKKLLIVAAAQNFNFIRDIGEALRSQFDVEFYTQEIRAGGNPLYDKVHNADVVWLEWADSPCIEILLSYNAKFILRIHRYELFQQRTLAAIASINPDKISKLLFVGDYIKQIGVAKFPWMERGISIPNLIDIDKFEYCPKSRGSNLLFLGRQSYVKNLPMMLHLFHRLSRYDHHTLHVVGEIADPELMYYRDNFIQKTGIGDRIVFHGRLEGDALAGVMAQMHYVICSSIFESQGVGILEAMAMGIKPVVYSFGGAENFFPGKYLYLTTYDFLGHFVNMGKQYMYNPVEYRNFVWDRYSIQKNLWQYADVIRKVAGD